MREILRKFPSKIFLTNFKKNFLKLKTARAYVGGEGEGIIFTKNFPETKAIWLTSSLLLFLEKMAGEVQNKTTFYQYLRSDGGKKEFANTTGCFRNFVPPRVFENREDWEVGISSISFPNSFYNIHGNMRKVTLGNKNCIFNFLLPAGRYTPEILVAVLNKIVKRELLHEKDQIQPGDWEGTYDEWKQELNRRLSTFNKITMNVGDIDEKSAASFTSKKDRERFMRERKKNARDLYTELHQEAIAEGGALNPRDFARQSKLVFFYDKFYHKIGVKSIMKDNSYEDYVIFHNEKLKDMLGMTKNDEEDISEANSNEQGFLAKEDLKYFTKVANFNIYLQNVFIYCNIVEESGIANSKSQISEIIPLPPYNPKKSGQQLYFNFTSPNYKNVDRSAVNCIEILLADCTGKEIKFNDAGETIIALKFRKKSCSETVLNRITQQLDRIMTFLGVTESSSK